MNRFRALFLGLCLVPLANAAGDAPRIDPVVDGAAQSFLAAHPMARAISIGVYLHGRTYTFNYGHLEPGAGRAPTSETLYPIASITKTFTGALLAQAQLEGKLQLGDDVRLYLDGDYPNLEFDGHPIRLFDLLDHRSGLPFFMPDRPETRPDFASDEPWATRVSKALAGYTRADFYADLHRVKLDAIPGESFKYSNAAAQLAGYLLERIYHEPYEKLLKRKVLAPLGMRDTTITLTPRQFKSRTRGYDGEGRPMPDNPDALQGAGAIKSSVNDMLKYIAWQVAESNPAVRLSHQPFLTSGNYAAGLNWQTLSDSGKRVIWQSGDLEGFHAYCIVEPERGLGVVALFNQADRESSRAHGVMVNEILKGLDPAAVLLP
jgi:CubicO group peptidase (beta-lactamase class C family)